MIPQKSFAQFWGLQQRIPQPQLLIPRPLERHFKAKSKLLLNEL